MFKVKEDYKNRDSNSNGKLEVRPHWRREKYSNLLFLFFSFLSQVLEISTKVHIMNEKEIPHSHWNFYKN